MQAKLFVTVFFYRVCIARLPIATKLLEIIPFGASNGTRHDGAAAKGITITKRTLRLKARQ